MFYEGGESVLSKTKDTEKENSRAEKYKIEDKENSKQEEEEDEDSEEAKEEDMIKFSKFFTYASKKDHIMMILGGISAVITGALLPCISLAFGEMTNSFNPSNTAD